MKTPVRDQLLQRSQEAQNYLPLVSWLLLRKEGASYCPESLYPLVWRESSRRLCLSPFLGTECSGWEEDWAFPDLPRYLGCDKTGEDGCCPESVFLGNLLRPTNRSSRYLNRWIPCFGSVWCMVLVCSVWANGYLHVTTDSMFHMPV